MIYNLLLAILSILFPSCLTRVDEKDVTFSERQLNFVNAYKTNDTLVFENKNYLPDTIIIHSLTKEQNFLNLNIRPLFAGNWQKATPEWDAMYGYKKFITLSKTSEQDMGSVSISFKGFQCSFIPDTLKSLKQLTVGDRKFSCYILRHQFPEAIKDNTYIVTLFWDKKQGLIAYEAKGEARWTRNNFH